MTVMISLCIHALLEGIPLGGGLEHNHSAEKALLAGIVLHKAPVAIVLFSFFLQSGMSKLKSYFLLLCRPILLQSNSIYRNQNKYNHYHLLHPLVK